MAGGKTWGGVGGLSRTGVFRCAQDESLETRARTRTKVCGVEITDSQVIAEKIIGANLGHPAFA
jgi:hypothetical protein